MRISSRGDVGVTRVSGQGAGGVGPTSDIKDRLPKTGLFGGQWSVNTKRGENHRNESDCKFCMECINA